MLITCITIYGFSDNFDKNIILGIALIFLVAVFAFFNLLVINSMIERSNFHFYGMMGSTFSEQGINYANIKNAPRPSGLARIALILYASTCAYYLFSKSKKLIVLVLIFIFGSFVLLYQSRTASFIFLFLNLFMIIFYFRKYFLNKKLIIFGLILPIICNASIQFINEKNVLGIDEINKFILEQ